MTIIFRCETLAIRIFHIGHWRATLNWSISFNGWQYFSIRWDIFFWLNYWFYHWNFFGNLETVSDWSMNRRVLIGLNGFYIFDQSERSKIETILRFYLSIFYSGNSTFASPSRFWFFIFWSIFWAGVDTLGWFWINFRIGIIFWDFWNFIWNPGIILKYFIFSIKIVIFDKNHETHK